MIWDMHGTIPPETQEANAMSEAPERIWVDTDSGELEDYGFDTYTEPFESADEYVHRSLYDAQAKVIEAARKWQAARAAFNEDEGDTKARFKAMADAEANLTATLAALQESSHE